MIEDFDPSKRRFLKKAGEVALGAGGAVVGLGAGDAMAQSKKKSPEESRDFLLPDHLRTAKAFAASFAKLVADLERKRVSNKDQYEQVTGALRLYLSEFAHARNVTKPSHKFHAEALKFALREIPPQNSRALSMLQFYIDEYTLLDAANDPSDPLAAQQDPYNADRTEG